MKILSEISANSLLGPLGMKVGQWRQITNCRDSEYREDEWRNLLAPQKSLQAQQFSQDLIDWFGPSDWTMIQFDNSTALDECGELFLKQLLFGASFSKVLGIAGNSLLFECFSNDIERCDKSEACLLWGAVFSILLFECHAQIIASSCSHEKHISIQDGYVYFMSLNHDDLRILPCT